MTKTDVQQETRRITVDLPEGIYRELKVMCAKDDTTMTAVLSMLLEKHFGKTKGGNK